ncbi:N-acetyltransferase family protein [Sphingorhabdus sp.]|uniref:GNAT family N-acetyltransferase n=1 Tax=Sphingorhabdus sp. TaxID=1902408 RepID=UPI00391967E8
MAQNSNRAPHLLCEIETVLSDGRPVCLRTIRPSDEAHIRAGITEMSDRSRYLRFFSAFRAPPDSIVKRLSAVDGHDHIGWGAILLDGEDNPPIGAAHAIRSEELRWHGELAIAVLDEYHGLGLARMLIAAVLMDCIEEDLPVLDMQMLAENRAAQNLVTYLGAKRAAALDSVSHYWLDVREALRILNSDQDSAGLKAIFAARGTN